MTEGLDVLEITDPLTDPAKQVKMDDFNVPNPKILLTLSRRDGWGHPLRQKPGGPHPPPRVTGLPGRRSSASPPPRP
ncbi:hypothetical protein GCM10020220_051910 [Nonomuraea rubra]